MPESGGRLLLDTHVWLWAVEGAEQELSAEAVEEIEEASRRGDVLVSAISVWEVAMLEAGERIRLSRTVEEWVEAALRGPGVRLLGLSPRIAVESTRLPGTPHGDPADRILMAGARSRDARLVTCDEAIIAYAEEGYLNVLDARP